MVEPSSQELARVLNAVSDNVNAPPGQQAVLALELSEALAAHGAAVGANVHIGGNVIIGRGVFIGGREVAQTVQGGLTTTEGALLNRISTNAGVVYRNDTEDSPASSSASTWAEFLSRAGISSSEDADAALAAIEAAGVTFDQLPDVTVESLRAVGVKVGVAMRIVKYRESSESSEPAQECKTQ